MFEWVDSGSPPVFGGRLSPPPGRAVNVLPRGSQAIEKHAEVVSGPGWRLAMAITYSSELLLCISDCFQQRDGIECNEPLAQLFFDYFVNIRRGQQTLTGCKWRMIVPAHQRTFALLAGQFERGLEEVHIQPGTLVKPPQRCSGAEPAQPPVAGQPPHHRAIFLLHPGLIVLAISARARPFE